MVSLVVVSRQRVTGARQVLARSRTSVARGLVPAWPLVGHKAPRYESAQDLAAHPRVTHFAMVVR
jgi:hypothetical protein